MPAPPPGARSPARPGTLRPVSTGRRTELIALLVVYVVPLTAALVFLASRGLWVIAAGLAAVEAVVLAAVVWAKRTSP